MKTIGTDKNIVYEFEGAESKFQVKYFSTTFLSLKSGLENLKNKITNFQVWYIVEYKL